MNLQVKYIFPAIDQALCSIANFLTVVIVAKAVAPSEFGIFIMIYSAIMIIAGIQSSLITGPIRVLGVDIDENKTKYYTSQLFIQLILSLVLALLFSLILLLFNLVDKVIILYSSLCIVFLQLYEFTRVIYLTNFDYKALLVSDFSVHITKLIILWLFYMQDNLSIENCFLIIFVTSSFSIILYLKDVLRERFEMSNLCGVISSNWHYGKWLLLETVAFLLSSRIYIYLIGLLIGIEQAGALGAIQNLLNTTNVLVMGVMAFAIPVARRAIINGIYFQWIKWLFSVGIFLLAVVIIVLLLMSIFSDQLVIALYGEFYSQYSYLIPLLAVVYVVSAINSVLSAAFRTVEQPEKGANAKLLSAVLTICLAYPLLKFWGLQGAVIGLIGTQLIWLLVYCIYISRGSLAKSEVLKSINKL